MSFKCPKCDSNSFRCYDSRPISKLVTGKHYFCPVCNLTHPSTETLDPVGVPKRAYVKSGKYAGGFKRVEGII